MFLQCFLIITRRAPATSTSALLSPTAEITPTDTAVTANLVTMATARIASQKVSWNIGTLEHWNGRLRHNQGDYR